MLFLYFYYIYDLQETLIVWSEGDNFDLALSFQEKAGCDEIWEKICQVSSRSILNVSMLCYSSLKKVMC